MKFEVRDVRSIDPLAVEIASQLSDKTPSMDQYRQIEKWLAKNPEYKTFKVDTLIELFDCEVGLMGEPSAHPQRFRGPI